MSTTATSDSKDEHTNSSTNTTTTNVNANPNPLKALGFHNSLILGSGSFTRKLILKEMNIPYHLMVRSIDEKGMGDRTPGSDASILVSLLAKAKADHLVQGIMETNYKETNQDTSKTSMLRLPESNTDDDKDEGWIILTADQVVTHNDCILEKPTSIEEAKEFVKGYADTPPKTVGACVLTHVPTMIQVSGVDTATIHFLPSVAEDVVSSTSNNEDDDEQDEKQEEGKQNKNKKKQKVQMDLIEALVKEGAPVLQCAGGLMVEHPLVKTHIEKIVGTEDSVMGLSKDLVLKLLQELRDRLDEISK